MAKNIIYLVILFCVVFGFQNSNAQVDGLMTTANNHYQNGRFAEAVKVYEEIVDKGYESPALYHNLGNAYYRDNKLGIAILYYEKGLRLSPNDEDINYNLSIANARTVDKIKEVPKLFILRWWDSMVTLFSMKGWLTVTLIVYFILLGSIVLYYFSPQLNIKRISFFTGVFLTFFLILIISLFIARINVEENTSYAVLIIEESVVKTTPSITSDDTFIIHEGIKFQVQDSVNDWSKIRLADGKVGWIPQSEFRFI